MNKINPNKQKKKITVKKWHRKYECNKEEKIIQKFGSLKRLKMGKYFMEV